MHNNKHIPDKTNYPQLSRANLKKSFYLSKYLNFVKNKMGVVE